MCLYPAPEDAYVDEDLQNEEQRKKEVEKKKLEE